MYYKACKSNQKLIRMYMPEKKEDKLICTGDKDLSWATNDSFPIDPIV